MPATREIAVVSIAKLSKMFYPSKEEFIKLSKKGNLIPVYKEILADMETPMSSFTKIDKGNYSYLLESVEGGEQVARYSFLGSNPSFIFKSKGRNIQIIKGKKKHEFITQKDPIYEIKKIMSRFRFVQIKGIPRFCGGLVGYIGYDMVRFFENLPDNTEDDLRLPDSIFMLTDTILIFDHIEHKIKVTTCVYIDKDSKLKADLIKLYNQSIQKLEDIIETLKRPIPLRKTHFKNKKKTQKIKSDFTKNEFKKAVLGAKYYIKRGDIIQAVLSQRFSTKINSKPLDIYRALRSINPSPYMFYLKFKDVTLIGSSPEILVRCEDRIVETRPIAGTRPRGRNELEDEKLTADLLNDPKERAEHIMLVDLGRNDIGRVCEYSTVKVNRLMDIEKYSHVIHIVSDCTGRLKNGKDVFDVIRAAFPAGTVTGAPKIRAMEIIDEFEKHKRGPYAGAVGYFSFSGNLDTCITIRTIIIKGNRAYIQAGAGIVADSKPQKEYIETQNKAKALIKAIQIAQEGLEK